MTTRNRPPKAPRFDATWCPDLFQLEIADEATLKKWRAKARRMLLAKPKKTKKGQRQ